MNDQLVSFSFSAISGFENCPRSFKYRYIDGIPSAFTSIEAWMGTSVHAALEWAYTEKKRPACSAIVDKYHKYWSEERKDVVKVVKRGFTEEHYQKTGEELLGKYITRVFESDSSHTMALESLFRIEIAEGIFYKGVIDRVSRSDAGVLRATDFKTGKVGKPGETLQLPSYAMFLFTKSIDEEIEMVYEDLKQERTVLEKFARNEAKGVKEQLLEKIARIRECRDFYPMPSILCSWCGYNSICDAASGNGSRGAGRSVSLTQGDSCPACKEGTVQAKKGKFGLFFGCSNYPACRFTAEAGGTINGVEDKKEAPQGEDSCPRCGGSLKLRSGKFGEFLGCGNFPQCRYTSEVKR